MYHNRQQLFLLVLGFKLTQDRNHCEDLSWVHIAAYIPLEVVIIALSDQTNLEI